MAFMKMVWQTDDSTFHLKVVAKIKDSTPKTFGIAVRARIKEANSRSLNTNTNSRSENS